MSDDLELISEAFNNLEEQKNRFLECERIFKAKYKEDKKGRTTKLKASDRSRSKLYIPLVKTTVFIIHAIFKTSFMSDRCPIEITRIGLRNKDDLILQNALTAALKNRWAKKEHKIGLSKAVLSSLYLPLGIVSLFFDKQMNDIRTRFIPITDLAFDKRASDINDIEYVAYKWNQSIREVRQKIKAGFYKKKDSEKIFSGNLRSSERVKMQDLYEKSYSNGQVRWRLKSYANDVLVREATFSRLPFHFGYCIEAMPSIDIDAREQENAVYGSCVPELVAEIQEEYNIKRNQKIDITENQIDPPIAVNTNGDGSVAVSDIVSRKKMIRVELATGARISDVIMPMPVAGTYQLSEEIAMLAKEYEIATGVNSVMTGQTSPSDRKKLFKALDGEFLREADVAINHGSLSSEEIAAALPEHLRGLYTKVRQAIDNGANALVEAGALDKDNAITHYIKHYYKKHLEEAQGNAKIAKTLSHSKFFKRKELTWE